MEKYIPKIFEPCVMKALKECKITKKEKCSIIRDIGRKMMKKNDTTLRTRTAVAVLAVKKYPQLGTCVRIS